MPTPEPLRESAEVDNHALVLESEVESQTDMSLLDELVPEPETAEEVPLIMLPRPVYEHVETFAVSQGLDVGRLILTLIADAISEKCEVEGEDAANMRFAGWLYRQVDKHITDAKFDRAMEILRPYMENFAGRTVREAKALYAADLAAGKEHA